MSSTAMREMKPEQRLSIEEFNHDGKAAVLRAGGTFADEREMQRMGKAQELRVRVEPPPEPRLRRADTRPTAQLQVGRHLRFRHDPPGHGMYEVTSR